MEAHAGAAEDQPRRHLRPLVARREQVRGWQRGQDHLRLLLREGAELVGGQAHQEAAQVHRDLSGLASQQYPLGRRLHRL